MLLACFSPMMLSSTCLRFFTSSWCRPWRFLPAFATIGRKHTVDRSGKHTACLCTVIDSKICHLMEFDCYICSYMLAFREQAGLLHYLVLWDENKFTADELQTLTNNLCYT